MRRQGEAGSSFGLRVACLVVAALPHVLRAETPDTRMDRLLATFPAFEDPEVRKYALPAIIEVWRDAQACVAGGDPRQGDLGACVAQVHQACLRRMGFIASSADRDCWDREIFAWMLLRQDARDDLIARVVSEAAAAPESFPKLSDDEDYSAAHLVEEIGRYDVEVDHLNDLACGIDIGLLGYDPGREAIPLVAIDRTYSCAVEAQVSVLRVYLEWLAEF